MSPEFRQALIEILLEARLVADEPGRILARIEELGEKARIHEPESLRELTCTVNVLYDYVRSAISPLERADELLDKLSGGEWPEDLGECLLLGPPVRQSVSAARLTATMMEWDSFCDHFSSRVFGLSALSEAHQEALWRRLQEGWEELSPTRLHVVTEYGAVWFTDWEMLQDLCSREGGLDATEAYEHLGLDWSTRWRSMSAETGRGSTRAVLVVVPLSERQRGDKGVRLPTAFDAWGSFLFSPGDLTKQGPWPDVGSYSRDPLQPARRLPEGVHGRVAEDGGLGGKLVPAGEVSGGDRIAQCGDVVARRAVQRLRLLLGVAPLGDDNE